MSHPAGLAALFWSPVLLDSMEHSWLQGDIGPFAARGGLVSSISLLALAAKWPGWGHSGRGPSSLACGGVLPPLGSEHIQTHPLAPGARVGVWVLVAQGLLEPPPNATRA